MKSLRQVLDEHQMNLNGQHDGWWECSCGEPYDGAHLVAAMGNAYPEVIDAAAEAMYIADDENPEPDWATLPEFGKQHYRDLAAGQGEQP